MGIKSAGEQSQRQLKKMLSKPEYERLIKGKPKPTARRNTGKSTYKKA